MHVILREREVELVPDTELDKQAIVTIIKAGSVTVVIGKNPTDRNWPAALHGSSLILELPDPNDWGS